MLRHKHLEEEEFWRNCFSFNIKCERGWLIRSDCKTLRDVEDKVWPTAEHPPAMFSQVLETWTDLVSSQWWLKTHHALSDGSCSIFLPSPFHVLSRLVWHLPLLQISKITTVKQCQCQLIILGVEVAGVSTCWWVDRPTAVINCTVMEIKFLKYVGKSMIDVLRENTGNDRWFSTI